MCIRIWGHNMINSVSFSQGAKPIQPGKLLNKQDINTLLKYASGDGLNQASADTFGGTASSAAKSAGVFEGLPFAGFLKKVRKAQKGELKDVTNEAIKKLNKIDADTVKKYKDILTGEGKLSEKLKQIYTTGKNYLKDSGLAKQEVKDIINNSGAKEKVAETITKKPGIFSKAANFIKKPFTKAAGALAKKFPNLASKLGKFGKMMKSTGAGFMLAFSGIIEGVTEVIPTFKELGFKKGMKQVLKSTVKVAGDTAGFIGGQAVGSTVGALAGAKVGALLGSVAPGIGNVIGAAVGFVGGLLGSFIAGKITKAVTGPSEREIAKEQQEQEQFEEIASSEENIELLKEITAQKIAEEYNQFGELSEDSLAALEILERNGIENPFAA